MKKLNSLEHWKRHLDYLFIEKDKILGWHYKVAWMMVEFNVMVNMLSNKVTDNIF